MSDLSLLIERIFKDYRQKGKVSRSLNMRCFPSLYGINAGMTLLFYRGPFSFESLLTMHGTAADFKRRVIGLIKEANQILNDAIKKK